MTNLINIPARGSRCTDCTVLLTKRTINQVGIGVTDLCSYCYDAAGEFNAHQDGQHVDGDTSSQCEGCGTYDPATYWDQTPAKPVATTGTKQVHRSHAACSHPRTPAGRAACRKALAALIAKGLADDAQSPATPAAVVPAVDVPEPVMPTVVVPAAILKLTTKQRDQAAARLSGDVTDVQALHRMTLALVAIARTKKTTIAKLSANDVRTVIATDAL